MKFFRIEDPFTGRGPYTQGDATWSDDSSRHPTPWEENLWDKEMYLNDLNYDAHSKMVCGFTSMPMLFQWWDAEMLEALRDTGHHTSYVMSTYRVHGRYVKVGTFQAVSVKDRMEKIGSMSLEDLLTMTNSYPKMVP